MGDRKPRILSDQKIGLFLLLFCVAMYFFIIPFGVEMYRRKPTTLTPATFPILITFILAILSLLLIVKNYFPKQKVLESDQKTRIFFNRSSIRVVLVIGLFFLYLILTPTIGYLTTSILLMPVFFMLFQAKNKVIIAVLSIGLPCLLYWFFAKVMLVMLPRGLLL